MIGNTESVFKNKWCTYDEEKMKDSTIEIALQINGKVKGSLKIEADANKDNVLALAKESLSDKLEGLNIVKEIYVPGRIVNIVAK